MKQYLLSIRDENVGDFGTIIVSNSIKRTTLQIKDQLNETLEAKKKNPEMKLNGVAMYPGEYSLWQLGDMDNISGEITGNRKYITNIYSLLKFTNEDIEGILIRLYNTKNDDDKL